MHVKQKKADVNAQAAHQNVDTPWNAEEILLSITVHLPVNAPECVVDNEVIKTQVAQTARALVCREKTNIIFTLM